MNVFRIFPQSQLVAAFSFLAFLLSACTGEPRYRIGVSQCSDDEWRHKMNAEMRREAAFAGNIDLEFRTARDHSGQQVADIRHFIKEEVDLLIVSPNEEGVTPVVEEAYDHGIPVILVDRKTRSDKYTAFVGADNYRIGFDAGTYVIGALHGRGTVMEIAGLAGSTPAADRRRGFRDALSAAPEIRIKGVADGAWQRETARHKMDSLLRTGGMPDLVFAQNDRMATGVGEAVRACGGHVKLVGVDALAGKGLGLDLVRRGVLDATFIYPTSGEKVIQTAQKILRGEPFERETLLSTALVDSTNARLMQMQTAQTAEREARIEELNERIDVFLSRYSTQKLLLIVCAICFLLAGVVIMLMLRAYWTKVRTNEHLASQARQLETQRDQLAGQRDQLIALSRQVEEATQSKLVFFTNVSHDFRTPLTLISAPTEQLLADSAITGEQRTMLKIIHKNVTILLRLVNQILDFRKYENGKLELRRVKTDMRASLDDWCEAFRSLAVKKHIRFTVKTEGEEPVVAYVDTEKMERILFNLLANAFRFTPENGCIDVTQQTAALHGVPAIQLTVRDTGSGISVEHIRHIFDRFYQAGVNHGGSGIGLALAKAFTELHGGTIAVESEEERGTRFTVIVPCRLELCSAEASAQAVAPRLTESGVEEELYSAGRDIGASPLPTPAQPLPVAPSPAADETELRPTVLCIDDNPDIRSYISGLLSDEFTVLCAADGREGLRMAVQYVPDAIVCDVMMPVMDGLKCLHCLKTEMRTSHIPVMMLTACSLDEQRISGFDSGADSYIAKPFNPAVFRSRLHNLIANRRRLLEFFADRAVISSSAVSEPDKNFADRFRTLLEENLSDASLSVEELGEKMGMSRTQLYRKLKALTNYSPVELLRIARLKRAKELLSRTDKAISEVAYLVGFSSPSYFTRSYKDYYGESPSDYIRRTKS